MVRILCILLFLVFYFYALAQQKMNIDASLDATKQEIKIKQEVHFTNTSTTPLQEIYFNDWANSFSSKTTPLGNRFSEDYERLFHFEKDEKRGKTTINSIQTKNQENLQWSRGEAADILIVNLINSLKPNETAVIHLEYTIKVSPDKFTSFGVSRDGNYHLRYWFIAPAVYKNNSWQAYSNKNLDDLYLSPTDISSSDR